MANVSSELTPEQVDYIKVTANTRGAAFNPTYVFEQARPQPSGFAIHVLTNSGQREQESHHGRDGWQTDETLFKSIVNDLLTDIEKKIAA